MKIQNISCLLTILTTSRLACAYEVFYCDNTAITDNHVRIAYSNAHNAPTAGYPRSYWNDYIAENTSLQIYPIFLNGETTINTSDQVFLAWFGQGVSWGVVRISGSGAQLCDRVDRGTSLELSTIVN
ncbi:unnamed protein product [Blumeria hordei]|uniref:Uncharacterized protein n=2 Tax=Blumeria hordei TaxID=2867405 RepID=A0A383UN41_BLUHO|nr:CSEP0101 putative effector protein [Blumeria hordei DH14]SZF00985.1 unnamed protein product [Blumeria hordei]